MLIEHVFDVLEEVVEEDEERPDTHVHFQHGVPHCHPHRQTSTCLERKIRGRLEPPNKLMQFRSYGIIKLDAMQRPRRLVTGRVCN
ncbi:hypothetical protein EVAR_27754_1 [Eumeta japonica]|uniref:Uncharacterized protein n=1 Tax=Eumeta variegata TaxID=151549 RepID=A0A4C1VD17_EUMVA|nr:hypothetical protein EVAR_27754_1 [Eumeta japonica]